MTKDEAQKALHDFHIQDVECYFDQNGLNAEVLTPLLKRDGEVEKMLYPNDSYAETFKFFRKMAFADLNDTLHDVMMIIHKS